MDISMLFGGGREVLGPSVFGKTNLVGGAMF